MDPRAPENDGFHPLLRTTELPPGRTRSFDVAGRRVLLCNANGQFFALENQCTHQRVSLVGGRLRGCILECPRHGGRFDVRDGSVKSPPPHLPLATFVVRVREGRVEVRLGPVAPEPAPGGGEGIER
jgi:nitrite reductase/ring-hydroxylating ferredoxin subunit